ncbi:MAG: DUF222 domain-containing protein [Acidimicrobiales bacterium]
MEWLASVPPGPELATALAGLERGDLNGHELVAVAGARWRLIAHQHAELAADVVDLAHCPAGGPDAPAVRGGLDAPDTTVDELRLALTMTRHAAGVLVDVALALDERLPGVGDLLREGRVDWARVRVMVDTTRELDADTARSVVDQVLGRASGLTTGELRSRLARMVIKADPEGAARRRREGLAERRVTGRPNPDGTGNLVGANLPGERVAAIMRRLTELARQQTRAEGDTRGIDQIRADALLQLLDPAHPGQHHTVSPDTDWSGPDAPVRTTGARGPDGSERARDLGDSGTSRGSIGGRGPAGSRRSAGLGGQGPRGGPGVSTGSGGAGGRGSRSGPSTSPGGPDDLRGRPGPSSSPGGPACPGDPACPAPDGAAPDDAAPDDAAPDSEAPGAGLAGRRGRIDIRIDLATLIGLTDRPAHIIGWGPVLADIARQIALAPTADQRWVYTITHPDTGVVLGTGTTRRRPNARQARHVTSSQPTCRFPGCQAPATASDIDHIYPYADGGPTLTHNLMPLCRHDHQVKHAPGWTMTATPDGHTWTTPHHHTYTAPTEHDPDDHGPKPGPRPGG